MNRTSAVVIVGTLALVLCACASAPPRLQQAPAISVDQKMAWMLQLEDQRILRVPPPQEPPVVAPVRGKAAAAPVPPPTPDLLKLVTDPEARIRRRAALSIGRVGLPEGVAPLQTALTDTDPAVRQMAAFGLGLIGDRVRLPEPVRHVLEEDEVDSINRPALATQRAAAASADAPEPPSLFSIASAGGISTLGSTFLPVEPDPVPVAELLLRRGLRFLPSLAGALRVQTRMCARPQSVDGRPLIGPVSGLEGLFVCAGHGPWGISSDRLGGAGGERHPRRRLGDRA